VTATGSLGPDPIEQFRRRLVRLPADPVPLGRADAAVLILARGGNSGLEILSEQRAERASDPWSGHVGLPGGRSDPSDGSLTDTVLRELREEVGILPSALDGPPRLFDVRSARPAGLRVAVFVNRPAGPAVDQRKLEAAEVTTTFWFPLGALAQIDSRPLSTPLGPKYVDSVVFEDHMVWGLTLRVLQDFSAWLATADSSN
jgi:8-oxo-dGTP pyrophosphatase MutT (NUDIX family)